MSYGRPPPRIDGMVSLKVDNLTYRTTPEDLRRVLKDAEKSVISISPETVLQGKVGASPSFYDKRDAEDALDAMDGRMLDGRELRVQMARYGRPTSPHRRYRGLVHVQDILVLALGLRGEEADPDHASAGQTAGAVLVQTAKVPGEDPGLLPTMVNHVPNQNRQASPVHGLGLRVLGINNFNLVEVVFYGNTIL
ncbi:hypothetical protein NQ317_011854 [Molorchus minor]|uniref:RRM domain-containing protein n=1 Tax=Molorchus minor TaxID=1323400 RepID=A0ABQ9JMF3_9CUCU|nr:hypothetical protein NQ317_011854 [Molorchus minor]